MADQIRNELEKDGFSINTLKRVLEDYEGRTSVKTFEYFTVIRTFKKAKVIINETHFHFGPDNIVFIGPNKKILLPEQDNADSIYIMIFSSAFYERSATDIYVLNSELFFGSVNEVYVAVTPGNEAEFQKQFIDKMALYESKRSKLYAAVAHNCIETLLLDGLFSLHLRSRTKKNTQSHADLHIISQFKALLHKHYKEHRSVAFYANMLNITPRKLSGITEEILGSTAKQLITDKVIKEVVVLLKSSGLGVAEIAYEFGFSDEGNFSNLIKKHTGRYPREMRSQKV